MGGHGGQGLGAHMRGDPTSKTYLEETFTSEKVGASGCFKDFLFISDLGLVGEVGG